ncbi:MAG: hypothetical protein Fur0010_08110 [Bdellovibrio sp.]
MGEAIVRPKTALQHITFIVPPVLVTGDNRFYIGRKGGPPLNIAYLAAITEKQNIDYDVVDGLESNRQWPFEELKGMSLLGLKIETIVERIPSHTETIAITSMFTSEWLVVRKLARAIKEKFPGKMIIIGGEHATADAEQIIRFENDIDVVFKGESEISFETFLQLQDINDLDQVPGIVFRRQNQVVVTKRSERITDLDFLRPSWKKINVDYYLDNKLSYSELGRRTMPVISSRGCPYKCTFCSNLNMWGTRYVTRSVDLVIEELRHYIEQKQVEHFDFIDLATSVNRPWFKQLLEKMISDLPPFSWEMTVGTRSEILDEEILDLLYRSGSRVLSYAPETGSESMAKKIKKRINHGKMYSSMRAAVQRGFVVKANVVIGFPDESLRELLATIWMSLKMGWIGVKGVTLLTYQPFLGTELSRELYQENNYEDYNRRVFNLSGREGAGVFNIIDFFLHPKKQIYNLITNVVMVLSFFIACLKRPRELIKSISNISQGKPIGAVEVAIHSIIARSAS